MTEVDPGVIRRLADMHAVYRMFDHAGRLLYIGMTGQAGQRFGSHSQKVWFPLVSMITLEWHTTHAEAYLAETRAIAAEHPRYNVAGTPKLAARRGRGQSAARPAAKPAAPPPDRNALGDVLKIFGDASGLHWQTIADRLAAQFPERWAGVSSDAISAQVRALGVPSVCVSRLSSQGRKVVLRGCRRADVEVAAANQILGEACGRP